jgi:hypothetical protein
VEQGNNILGDLKANVYSVPDGYFENLAAEVLKKIQAKDEIAMLSPLLSSISRQMPYSVPDDYSSLLEGLKKKETYKVPEGYFKNLLPLDVVRRSESETKVISIARRGWFRVAAAAAVVGVITLAGLLFFGNKKETVREPLAKFTNDVKKMNEVQKEDMIDFIDAGMTGKESAKVTTDNKSKDVEQLLQDVPEQELKDFVQQTEDVQDVLMTN